MCSLVCFSQTSTKPGRKSLKNQNKKEYSLNSKGKTKGQDNFREEGYVTQGGEEEVEGEQGSKKESLELVEETCEHPQVRIGDPEGQVSWDRIQMPCFKLINTEVVASQQSISYRCDLQVLFLQQEKPVSWLHMLSPLQLIDLCLILRKVSPGFDFLQEKWFLFLFNWVMRKFWQGPISCPVVDECLVTAIAIKQGSFLKWLCLNKMFLIYIYIYI